MYSIQEYLWSRDRHARALSGVISQRCFDGREIDREWRLHEVEIKWKIWQLRNRGRVKKKRERRENPRSCKGFTLRRSRICAARLSFHVSVPTGIGRAITRGIKMETACGKHVREGPTIFATYGFIFAVGWDESRWQIILAHFLSLSLSRSVSFFFSIVFFLAWPDGYHRSEKYLWNLIYSPLTYRQLRDMAYAANTCNCKMILPLLHATIFMLF